MVVHIAHTYITHRSWNTTSSIYIFASRWQNRVFHECVCMPYIYICVCVWVGGYGCVLSTVSQKKQAKKSTRIHTIDVCQSSTRIYLFFFLFFEDKGSVTNESKRYWSLLWNLSSMEKRRRFVALYYMIRFFLHCHFAVCGVFGCLIFFSLSFRDPVRMIG